MSAYDPGCVKTPANTTTWGENGQCGGDGPAFLHLLHRLRAASDRICATIAAHREGASGRSRFDGALATAGVAET